MKLIYIIDNCSFNDSNQFIFGLIKRWIVYELVSMVFSNTYTQYEDITLIKTTPQISICTLNFSKNNIISTILYLINSIIFKKYTEYPIDNMINTFEELINNFDIDSKIIYFSAINNLNKNILTKDNKIKINNIFGKFKNKIYFYNISTFAFLSKIFNNVQEIFIDYRTIKFNDIISNIIFTIKPIDYSCYSNIIGEIKLINEMLGLIQNNISSLCSDNSDISSDINFLIKEKLILNYVMISYKIELLLVNNCIGIINTSNDFDFLQIINNYLDINLEIMTNNKIGTLLYNLKNSIKKIFDRNTTLCPITVPSYINDETDLESEYIKYIMEFYKEIYPKLISYHCDLNTKKFKLKNTTTKQIISSDFKKITKIKSENISDDSIQYFVSNTTMTNWVDEFNELNPFGILIKYNISRHSYKGIIDGNSSILFNYPNIIVSSISNNWISIFDYYQMVLNDINHKCEEEINKNYDHIDLNNFNIIDNLNGDTNIMLPIYINQNHWNLTKVLWSYHMSFINLTFEHEYNKKMDNIYYLVLLKCFNQFSDNNKFNTNQIRLFICILRTCIQITIDNKYIIGIRTEIDKYFNNLTNSPNKYKFDNFKSNYIDYLIRLLQLIISSKATGDLVYSNIICIRKIFLHIYLDYTYDEENWNNLAKLSSKDKIDEIENIKNNFIQNNLPYFNLEIDIICLCEFINELYKIKNFNQFIKIIDKTNGCIGENLTDGLINCEIIKNIYWNLSNPKIFNINNYTNEINIHEYILNKIDYKE